MLIAAAREVSKYSRLFVGFHWPILVAELARRLYNDGIALAFEGGVIVEGPFRRLPTSTTEYNCFHGCSTFHGDSLDLLYGLLRRGGVEAALLAAGNVDQFGNVNSTLVRDGRSVMVRLAGGGGAAEVAAFAKRVYLVVGATEPKRYVSRVDFVTASCGRRNGEWVSEKGVTGRKRLVAMFCPFGVFGFENEEGRAELETVYPGVGYEEFVERVGWPVRPGGPRLLEEMTEAERAAVREVLQAARERGYVIAE